MSFSTPCQREWSQSPLSKLTVRLLDTYRRINDSYYEAKFQIDDADNDLIIRPGQVITPSDLPNHMFRLEKRIGKGSFGQVVSATELHTKLPVAIKIIKGKRSFSKQAKEEIRLLYSLNHTHIVRLLNVFTYKNHQCLVFERLSINLYDLLRNTSFNGISFYLLRKFAKQILDALQYLRENRVIHCDLKPENILLCKSNRSFLKVIDFGSSCTVDHKPFTYIQSRFYRAPEVIFGADYSCAIDMWSLGAILIEMHTGEPMFPGQNELEQVHCFMGTLGPPPLEFLATKKASAFFQPNGRIKPLPLDSPFEHRMKHMTISQALGYDGYGDKTPFVRRRNQQHLRSSEYFEGLEKYLQFADWVGCMLRYSPHERITPLDAIRHVFMEPLPSMVAPPPLSSSASTSPVVVVHGNNSRKEKQIPSTRPPKRRLSQ